MHIGTGIYVKNSLEAVELYKAAFGLSLGYHVMNPDGGGYYHSELMRGGQEMFDVIESAKPCQVDTVVQASVILDSAAEVEKAYALLCDGGTVETPIGPLPWSPCAFSLTDKFGVWWYVSAPQHYPGEDFDPAAAVM